MWTFLALSQLGQRKHQNAWYRANDSKKLRCQQDDWMKKHLHNFMMGQFNRTSQTIYLDEILCFIYIKLISFLYWEKVNNFQNVCSWRNKLFVDIIFLVFAKSDIQYLKHKEINVSKVLVRIKVVLVKNDNFLHQKSELHKYRKMNGFLNWRRYLLKQILCIY